MSERHVAPNVDPSAGPGAVPNPAADPAYRINGHFAPPAAFYAAACDPRRSIVVEACAGAGKTWMLVSRILRALLEGAQPQEILALTFTRKAAGEMRARLNEWLREFSCAPNAEPAQLDTLAAALRQRGLGTAQASALAPALGALHGQLLQSGRSVAIRSFHAWFAQLLAAAPLDLLRALNLPSQPTLVEDTAEYEGELFAAFHTQVQANEVLRATYIDVIRRRRIHHVQRWLKAAWQRRTEVERADAAGTLASSVPAAAELWPECAGLATPLALLQQAPLAGELAALARALGAQENKTPRDAAQALRLALDEPDPVLAHAAARAALMTKDNSPRKRMGELPALAAAHAAACDALLQLQSMVDQQAAHEEHAQMVALVRVLLAEYAALKRRRGLADMGDLEAAALALLADPTLAGWVQERLDTQLKHLLIDEFQDTSPLQWQALLAWLSSYAGAGGGASGQRPLSVFIVGDPKQSIYRFRRAEPRVFEAAREFVVHGLEGAVLECDHTRRCAPEVVAALNAVFEPLAAAGEWPGFRTHTTPVPEGGGLVLRLPEVLRPERAARSKAAAAVWRDTLTQPRHEPEEQLRAQEARHVAQAIASLLASGRRPKDVMVLARKRVALRAVSEALSALQLPHVMPEALRVGHTPEAKDLLAVVDVLVSPGHDLALARALRSPVFGASDVDLLVLSQAARTAGCSWWAALVAEGDAGAAPWAGALARAAGLLRAWAEALTWLPPHDLLDRIVHESDFVARLAAAAPPARREAALQAVDALLAAALQLDSGRYATPYAFVRALRSRPVEAAQVPAADAVRLLTVHGAKGLEAPAVFIVDTDPARARAESAAVLVDWPVDRDAPARVAFVAHGGNPPASLQALQRSEAAASEREELNGLYVAMSRAAEELVISRTQPVSPPERPSWWARLHTLAAPWDAAATAAVVPAAHTIFVPALPVLVHQAPAAAPQPAALDPAAAAIGRAVHRVLEWAARPGAPLAPNTLAPAATAAALAFGLSASQAADVERTAARVLTSPQCRHFFDPAALAWAGNEVPVVVGEPGRGGGGPGAGAQAGRIDRLVALDGPAGRTWWVLDYKLGARAGEIDANRVQLAAYVSAVRALQPADSVSGAFITGAGELVLLGD